MNKNFVFKIGLIALMFLPTMAEAQTNRVKDNSPYSRLGLGDLFNRNFSAIRGMGGLSAAYHDPMQMNLLNPASLGHLQATTFEAGIFSEYSQLSNSTETADVLAGNLGYLSLGFATQNRLNQVLDRRTTPWSYGMNFTLLPYSNVNYGVQIEQIREDGLSQTDFFEGSGGTYQFLWGNGVRYKNFSFGINLGYIFGKINNDRNVLFSAVPSYGIITQKGVSIRGFSWNAGAQYDVVFKKTNAEGAQTPTGRVLTFGITGNNATDFTTTSSLLEFRRNNTFNDLDTLTNQDGLEQSGVLPSQFSLGIMLRENNKWKLGANFDFGNWSEYFNEGLPTNQELNDSWNFSVGGEYTPDYLSYNSFAKKIRYRAGAFYGKDPRLELNTYGVNFGFGLPIVLPRQTVSFVNFAIELGTLQGAQDLNLVSENYVNLTAGFTLNDNTWFFKRKFN